MSRVQSAPEAASFNSSPGYNGLSSPECVIPDSYIQAVRELGLPINPEELPELLTSLTRNHEHLIRARYGLFPYARIYSLPELTGLHGISYKSAEDRLYRARHNLREASQNSDQRTKQRSATATYTLEELARLLDKNEHRLTEKQRDVLCALNGLPPYLPPLSTGQYAQRTNTPRKTVARTEQAALKRVGPQTPTAPQEETVPAKLSTAELAKRMELGWYAASLLRIANIQTAEEEIHNLQAGAMQAATMRTRKAKRLNQHARAPFSNTYNTAAPAEMRKPLVDLYTTEKDCDTVGGRQALTHMVIERAAVVMQDIDTKNMLRLFVAEGEHAEEQLLRDNVRLIFYTAARLLREKERAVEYGYEGLLRAVRGYDYALGYAFSTYAIDWIVYYMREGLRHEWGVSKKQASEIWKMRSAEAKLQQQYGTLTISNRQLALATGLSVARVEENKMILQRTNTKPFNSISYTADAKELHHLPPEAKLEDPSARITEPDMASPMREALEVAFTSAHIAPKQRRIICALYGLPPYDHPYEIAEVAAQLHCSVGSVSTTVDNVFRKISDSKEAAAALHSYLKQAA